MQSTEYSIDTSDNQALAASMWSIENQSIHHPILELESHVSKVLATMEVQGVYVDRTIIDNLEQELTKAIQAIESKVAAQTGDTIVNLASPLQLQKLLFETMGIKPLKKTKTGWSVDEETLTMLAEEHEICREILTHRHASKLLGTYVR